MQFPPLPTENYLPLTLTSKKLLQCKIQIQPVLQVAVCNTGNCYCYAGYEFITATVILNYGTTFA